MELPEGTCVVLMRHAESEWNRERVQAFKRGAQPPARIPDKQDADLSPFGRVQAFLAGIQLREIFAAGNVKPRCDSVAHSSFNRAEQTANWAMRAACLNPRYTAVANELNEQSHGAMVPPDLAALLNLCLEVVNSGDMNPEHAELFRGFFEKLVQFKPQPFPAPHMGKPTPTYGLEIGYQVNMFDAMRREAERLGASSLSGEEKMKAWRKAFDSAMRSTLRLAGKQALPILAQEDDNPLERRKTPMGESFKNLVPRAESFLRFLERRALFYGDRHFLVVTHSKIVLAIRQMLEGLDDQTVADMLTAEGPPFPPYVGMNVYSVRDGVLTLEGEPYRMPPMLVPKGRELKVVAPYDALVEQALKITGTEMRRVRKRGKNSKGDSNRQAYVFKDSTAPRLAVASSPYLIISPRRRSEPPTDG